MKFTLPEVKKLVFEMTIPIRWGDMDAMNHVNNTIYFRYLESCRIEWMRSINALPNPKGEAGHRQCVLQFLQTVGIPGRCVGEDVYQRPRTHHV